MYIFTNSSNFDKILQTLLLFPKSLLNLSSSFLATTNWSYFSVLATFLPIKSRLAHRMASYFLPIDSI